MWRYSIAVVVLAALLVPTVVQAQFKGGDWETTLSGSGSNDKDFESGQFSIDSSLGYFLTDQFEIGMRNTTVWADGGSLHAAAPRLTADYHFDLGKWVPFVGANIGYQCSDTGADDSWIAGPEAGVKYFVNQTTFIQLLCAYEFNLNDGFDNGAFFYSLGVGFRW